MTTPIDGYGGGGMAPLSRTSQLAASTGATAATTGSGSATEAAPSIGDDENDVETSGSAAATWQQASESYAPAEDGEDEFLSLRGDTTAPDAPSSTSGEAPSRRDGAQPADGTTGEEGFSLGKGFEAAQQGKEAGEKVKKGLAAGKEIRKAVSGVGAEASKEAGKEASGDESESEGGFSEGVGGALNVVKGVTSAASLPSDESRAVADVRSQDFGRAAQDELKAGRDGTTTVAGVNSAAKLAQAAPGQAGRIAKTVSGTLGKTVGKDGDVAKLALGGRDVALGAKAVPIIGVVAAGVDATYRVTDMANNWGHMSTAARVSDAASLIGDVATVAAVVTPPPIDVVAGGVAVGAGLISLGIGLMGGG